MGKVYPPHCPVPGCGNPSFRWTPFCMAHALRNSRHGSPTGRTVGPRELRTFRREIEDGLARYRSSKPVIAALAVADELLRYAGDSTRGRAGLQPSAEQEMRRLFAQGVTPYELVRTVAEVMALQLFGGGDRFGSPREIHSAIARCVLKLRPRKAYGFKGSPATLVVRSIGARLFEELGEFAIHFLRRIESDHARRRERSAAMVASFDE